MVQIKCTRVLFAVIVYVTATQEFCVTHASTGATSPVLEIQHAAMISSLQSQEVLHGIVSSVDP